MKTKIVIASALFLFLGTAWIKPVKYVSGNEPQYKVSGKPAGQFSFFRTHRQGPHGVAATWGVSSSSGISCFVLQRTYEFPDEYATWENVFEVPCNGARSYGAMDVEVYPGEISYRVVAMNGTITSYVSPISSIRIRQR